MKRGEIISKENIKGITVLNWKDKRNVIMLSTKHTNETVDVPKRNGESVAKPKVVADYNKAKSSVDLSDQMAAYSSPLRKTVKWYKKLTIELLLSTALINAYILYRECTGNVIGIVDF
ncbi:unnamed protein product [Acanthoscelides obtectus]|uniref:PiggyBac transposable element-derived protein domain-containing protein n=1 Tax=Acanthoscelides obtectus TaxID=200917 RepID=A0A9P0PGH9_ACAOB|nr:unnamed protein product [Acanthoscelides obtectus]CAK1628494.1 PiggyBac transposable element-derived protein 4 [Acanthoscelides obtectus]